MIGVGMKRRGSEGDGGVIGVTPGRDYMCREQSAVRIRRNVELEPLERVNIHALLKEDRLGFERYGARCALLDSLGVSVDSAKKVFLGLNCHVDRFLMVVDLNERQSNLARLFQDMEARSIPLHSINVKSLSISHSDNRPWLKETCGRRVDDYNCRNVISVVMDHIFAPHEKLSVTILYGGGVRDVLLTDWCRAYGLTGSRWIEPTFIVINSVTTGRTFYVPAKCF